MLAATPKASRPAPGATRAAQRRHAQRLDAPAQLRRGRPPGRVGAQRIAQHCLPVASDGGGRRAARRVRAAGGAVQQHAERIDVDRRAHRLAPRGLRGEVVRRAGGQSRGVVAAGEAGAEVHQHRVPAAVDHHVRRGHVAVHQPGVVHRLERGGEFGAEAQQGIGRQPALARKPRVQGLALDPVGPQTGAVVVVAGTMHGQHVGVAHARQATRLGHEIAAAEDRVRRIAALELQRDVAVERRVPGAEHLAEGAAPGGLEALQVAPGRPHGRVAGQRAPDRRHPRQPARELRIGGRDGAGVDRLAGGDAARRLQRRVARLHPSSRAKSTIARETSMCAAPAVRRPSASAISAKPMPNSKRRITASRRSGVSLASAAS
jgi:hypothetical protein